METSGPVTYSLKEKFRLSMADFAWIPFCVANDVQSIRLRSSVRAHVIVLAGTVILAPQ